MSNYTKGPWRIWKSGNTSWQICEPSNPNRHNQLATVRVGNMWGEEGEANAKLIAAAPEMFEALKICLDWLQGDKPGRATFVAEVIDKAEGRL